MKILIRAATEKKISPKKYIYDIAEEIGYRPPSFTDPAAGGYKMSYRSKTEDEAKEDLEKMKAAAEKLGIKVLRPQVKHEKKDDWRAYMVVPRYEEE